MEDYRIKIVNSTSKTEIMTRDLGSHAGFLKTNQSSNGRHGTTTEDLDTEGRDTVTDYSTVDAFHQLRQRTFISNKKGIESTGSESIMSGSKSPFSPKQLQKSPEKVM